MMKPGPLRLPEGITMKITRSYSLRGNVTSGCSIVARLELEDGELDVVGVQTVWFGRAGSCAKGNPDVDGLGEAPEERRRLSCLSEYETSDSD